MIKLHPIPFVLAASDHGPMIVCRTDYHQLENGGIYGVGAQILGNGAYDRGEIQTLLSILDLLHQNRSGHLVILDCGANIGVMTLEMAKHTTDWGRVYAFEAQERLYYALCGNICLNNLFNVSAMNVALGAQTGHFRMPLPNYQLPGSFGSLELRRNELTEYIGQSVSYQDKDLVDIRMFAIDDLGLDRADFLKIDVEGMEMEVLSGASKTISQHRPVLHIEWIKCGLDNIKDFLAPLKYHFESNELNVLAYPEEMSNASK
jgi:FkbM family methyltransferase